jgi:DNA-binding transcriptional ArsR family regulator
LTLKARKSAQHLLGSCGHHGAPVGLKGRHLTRTDNALWPVFRACRPGEHVQDTCKVARMSDRSDVVSMETCLVRMVDRERVAAVQESMPPAEDVEQVADVFALLGDPNRLRLLVALLEGGEMCVCDLAAAAGMSESAASHAVRWLRAHRIVSSPRRQGRMMYYRLEDAHVRMLLDVALTHSQHTRAVHPEREGA